MKFSRPVKLQFFGNGIRNVSIFNYFVDYKLSHCFAILEFILELPHTSGRFGICISRLIDREPLHEGAFDNGKFIVPHIAVVGFLIISDTGESNSAHRFSIVDRITNHRAVAATSGRLGINQYFGKAIDIEIANFGICNIAFDGYNGAAGISPEMDLRLSKALGTTPGSWYGMQANFDMWHAAKTFRAKVRPIAMQATA